MKNFELKLWHPITGFAIAKLLQNLNTNLIKPEVQPILGDIITWIENLCVILTLYIIVRNIYRSVTEPTVHWESYEYDEPYPKTTHPNKMKEIEQELDEIEATLNAVSPGDKVTPIWEISNKKK